VELLDHDEIMSVMSGTSTYQQKFDALEYASGWFIRNSVEWSTVEIYLKALGDDDTRILSSTLHRVGLFFGHRSDFFEPVKQFLQHESEDVRKEAVYALGSFRTVESLQLITSALDDESKSVRLYAILQIRKFGTCRIQEPWLLELRNVETVRFEKEISSSIEMNQNSFSEVVDCVEEIIGLYENGDKATRRAVVKTLGRIDHPMTIELLLTGLADESAEVRAEAAYSIGTKKEVGAVDHLIDLLSDNSQMVRFNAAEALGIIGDQRAYTPLAFAWSKEDEPEVKRAMRLILDQISS
jgi:hypothetical protein